jgi:hypothetical protein
MTMCQLALDINQSLTDRKNSASELALLKKKSKSGWAALGIGADEVTKLEALLSQKEPEKEIPIDPPGALTPSTTEGLTKSAGGVRAKIINEILGRMNDTKATWFERGKAAQELLDFRKKTKNSWEKLGFGTLNDDNLRAFIQSCPKDEPKAKPKAKPTKAKKPEVPTIATGTKERAHQLFNSKDWVALKEFKKSKKKSWEALGFTPKEIERIMNAKT